MATLKSFKALRYTSKDLNTLVCPPYDIISEEQREKYIAENEHNIIRLELPTGEDKYKSAGKLLYKWLNEGILKQDENAGMYVYEMEFSAYGERKKVKGIISLVKLEDFSKGIVLPHEETLSKAKQDRFNLMSETYCNFSQIYSLYMDDDRKVYSMIEGCSGGKPDMEVTDLDGTVHRVWYVYDENIINRIEKAFGDKKLYIADGHHRYETALNFHKYLCEESISDENSLSGYIEMMLVNIENEGLVVFPTHRIVRGLDNFNKEKVLLGCKEYFEIKEVGLKNTLGILKQLYDSNKKAFAFYSGEDICYVMVLKNENAVKELLKDKSEAYCGLDVSILHSLVLEKILLIDKENMANQKNLVYSRDFDEAINAVLENKANCSFILNPTRVKEISDVATAGEKMPQKSTYFYPKLITGLVMNKFR